LVSGGILGGGVAVACWLLLVPWDLSEVDERGVAPERGGDEYGAQIAVVGLVVVVAGLVTTLRASTRHLGPMVAAGGLAAWSVLFAWRAGAAETSGANMFMVPLVAVMLPSVVVIPLLLRRTARLADGWDRTS